MRTYRIFDKILMEIDVSKPAERAIPFGAYEPVFSSRFMDQLNQGATVLDIGSWIGYYALLAACDSGLVIAIEADETNCARINRNIELNHFSNVKVLNVAVGDGEYWVVSLKGQVQL